MSDFEKISKMDLANIDRPDGAADPEAESSAQTEAESTAENGTEEKQVKHEMAKPVGEHYYVNAMVTDKELIPFVFRHTYTQPVTLIFTVIGIVWPIYNLITHQRMMISLACAFVFLIFYPLSTYVQGKKANKANRIYDDEFHYMVDEVGLHLEVLGDAADFAWKDVVKMTVMKPVLVLYTGRNRAFLMPTGAMGDQKDTIIEFIRRHIRENGGKA